MKVSKWVDFGQEVEVELSMEDVRAALNEAFYEVTREDRLGEPGPTNGEVMMAFNNICGFLRALTDQQIAAPMTHKPPKGIDALFKLSRKVAAEYTKHAGSDDLCELEGEECLADFLYRALSDTQGIDAPNCAHKQLKKQMVGEFVYYVCECGQKFRIEPWDGKVSVLPPPDPRKDLAAPDVDALAQEIRRVDGNHSLGAGALAEHIIAWLAEMRGAKR